jgi:hypothetical protein
MRHFATIGFCLTAFMGFSIAHLVAAQSHHQVIFWVIGAVLWMSPLFWFWHIGSRQQFTDAEILMFLVFGIVGTGCFWLLVAWQVWGYSDPWPTAEDFLLLPFWGSAGIAVMKLGGTLATKVEPERYNSEYLNAVKGKTGDGRAALGGILLLVLQLVWLITLLR